MTLDSLSESSLLRLEQYLSSNFYRDYFVSKPHFPKSSNQLPHSNRIMPDQQSAYFAYHELMDNQKDSATLDRLAYKLRMKSDLNIDTLRETHARRRRHRHPHNSNYHHNQQHNLNSNMNESLNSITGSLSTKMYTRQPTAITTSSNTMKTMVSEDLNGIEGNSIRVGTLDDLIKQFRRAEFRLVRRPADYLDSASTFLSSNVSTTDRTVPAKPKRRQERRIKQPQALTEYQFNIPTIPTTPSKLHREPTVHQGLVYQYRTRERNNPTDLPLLTQRLVSTPEQGRQRYNSIIIQERQSTAMSSHEKRIQELREKTLMRTEKQVCVCNKLNIVDPFNTPLEQNDSNLPQLSHTHQHQQQQQQPAANYIFPPVRPFGYFTKKSTTNDDTQSSSWVPPPPPRMKKKRGMKKKRHKMSKDSLDSLDKLDLNETHDDTDNSQILNDTVKSMVSLTDIDDDLNTTAHTIANIDLNLSDRGLANKEQNGKS